MLPIFISKSSYCSGGFTGLSINTAAQINAGSTITLRSYIGWGNQLNLTIGGQALSWGNSNPVRIYLSSVNYNSEYIKQIIQQPQYSLKYEDYYVDIDEKKIKDHQFRDFLIAVYQEYATCISYHSYQILQLFLVLLIVQFQVLQLHARLVDSRTLIFRLEVKIFLVNLKTLIINFITIIR